MIRVKVRNWLGSFQFQDNRNLDHNSGSEIIMFREFPELIYALLSSAMALANHLTNLAGIFSLLMIVLLVPGI